MEAVAGEAMIALTATRPHKPAPRATPRRSRPRWSVASGARSSVEIAAQSDLPHRARARRVATPR